MKQKTLPFDTSRLRAYSGYYVDTSKLKESASGGAASALAETVLARNGVVFGVGYTSDFKGAEYFCIERIEDLKKIKGSKYIETAKRVFYNGEYQSVYRLVEQKLKEAREVIFFGLGCTVAALYAVLKKRNVDSSNLYTVELICHGTTPAKVAQSFVEDLENKYRSKIVDFSVRYKKIGWTPAYIRAQFQNKRIYEIPFYSSEYGYAFNLYSRSSCYHCSFRGESHRGDLTIGDYWGLTSKMNGYNKNGVSIIITQTPKGELLLSRVEPSIFHIIPTDLEFALENNQMYYRCRTKSPKWEKFGNYLKEYGLHYAVTNSEGIIQRLLRKSSLFVWAGKITPGSIKCIIKRILKI